MPRSRLRRRPRAELSLLLLLAATRLSAAVPAGFQDTLVASNIVQPTTIAFAPDGRMFLAEKASGKIKIVKNGVITNQILK
jgi:glucose/arabinose dehydrogenase